MVEGRESSPCTVGTFQSYRQTNRLPEWTRCSEDSQTRWPYAVTKLWEESELVGGPSRGYRCCFRIATKSLGLGKQKSWVGLQNKKSHTSTSLCLWREKSRFSQRCVEKPSRSDCPVLILRADSITTPDQFNLGMLTQFIGSNNQQPKF